MRTYVTFKIVLQTEEYLGNNISRHKRSLLAQLRLSILPLEIEVGSFRNIPVQNRLCKCCNNNVVENEFHFVCECECVRYADLRTVLYSLHNFTPDLDVQIIFSNIMSTQFKFIAAYLEKAWKTHQRYHTMYKICTILEQRRRRFCDVSFPPPPHAM